VSRGRKSSVWTRDSTPDPCTGSGRAQNRRPVLALGVRSRWIGRREGGAAAMEERAIGRGERTKDEGVEAAVLLAVFPAVLRAVLLAVVVGVVDDVRLR
jgi:hypothetical protein